MRSRAARVDKDDWERAGKGGEVCSRLEDGHARATQRAAHRAHAHKHKAVPWWVWCGEVWFDDAANSPGTRRRKGRDRCSHHQPQEGENDEARHDGVEVVLVMDGRGWGAEGLCGKERGRLKLEQRDDDHVVVEGEHDEATAARSVLVYSSWWSSWAWLCVLACGVG